MNKKTIFFIALAVSAIFVLVWFAPLHRTAGVHIGFSVGTSQGAAENNTGMESIKVNGSSS